VACRAQEKIFHIYKWWWWWLKRERRREVYSPSTTLEILSSSLLLFLLLLFTVCRFCACDVRTHTNKITQRIWKTSYVCKLDHLLVIWWWWWEDKGEKNDRQRPTTTIQLVLAPKKMCLFNALSICLAVRSMFLIDIYIYKKEKKLQMEKKRERGSKRRRKGEIMDLCVLRVDIPREQVILTLCMHALSSSLSLSLSYGVACSSK